MSAIEEAKKNQGKAQKTYEDIYKGPATITAVTPLAPRFTDGLTEEEASCAFDIQIMCKPDQEGIDEQEIVMPYSSRVGKFSKTGKTEAEETLNDLTRQGLVVGGDIATVFDAVGKKAKINAYKETSAKGVYARCRLDFGPDKLSQNEIARRIAAMTGRVAAPAAAQSAAPAPKVNPFA